MDTSTYTTSILAGSALALLLGFYYRYSNVYSYWVKRGVSNPSPIYLIGNTISIYYDFRTNFIAKCVEKYGRVFGIYEGDTPVLMVADVEVARQICIQDFDVFSNHKLNRLFNDFQKRFIFALQDDHWRRVRALMSPTFTSGKMRRMVKLLERCVEDLCHVFDEQIEAKRPTGSSTSEVSINLKDTYSLYTLDAITTCCYALKLERQRSVGDLNKMASRDEFIKDALALFKFRLYRLLVAFVLPDIVFKLIGFEAIPSESLRPIAARVSGVISGRRKSDKKFDDYLQLLLDAKLQDEVELDHFDQHENHHANLTNETLKSDQNKLVASVTAKLEANGSTQSSDVGFGASKSKFMSDDEILANAVLLLVVGLETTANLLTNATYAMAFHKDVQDKLREEIRKIARYDSSDVDKKRPLFDYDAVTSCKYLDAVISETLRCLAPVTMTDRVCNQDYHISKYNITIPAGTKVFMHLSRIMSDPEYWSEPTKFNPERFMPEQKDSIVPGSYCPFGLGPRHCLGMRFSLTESKLALAKLILTYEYSVAPKTSFPPVYKPNLGLRVIENPTVLVKRIAV